MIYSSRNYIMDSFNIASSRHHYTARAIKSMHTSISETEVMQSLQRKQRMLKLFISVYLSFVEL